LIIISVFQSCDIMNKVINFHDVRNIIWLEKTINILKNKFNLVSIKEIEDFYYNRKTLINSCHLTIDDGDKTFYNIIYPVLKKMNIPATIFVSPKICSDLSNFWFQEIRLFDQDKMRRIISENYNIDLKMLQPYSISVILKNMNINQIWDLIDRYNALYNLPLMENQNMSIEQLRQIDRDGLVSIGAHTMNHPILVNENEESSKREIVESIRELENILEHQVKYFAYPNGTPILDFSHREIEILKNANCSLAFSTEAKNFTLSDNPLSIPRFGLSIGNKFIVKAKLFLGKNWNSLKNIKSKDEIKLRIAMNKKMNLSKS
jgi:peptidoglycan/xylan/chitin deacetylase (PgdA/CDA1 family)